MPEIGRSMGRGMKEFKDSVTGRDNKDEPAELPPPSTETTSVPAQQRERDSVT